MKEELRFSSEEEFSDWVRRNARQTGIRDVEDLIEHERDHYELGKSLGYKPFYAVEAYFQGKDIRTEPEKADIIHCYIDYDGERPGLEDKIKILGAPKEPSPEDEARIRFAEIKIMQRDGLITAGNKNAIIGELLEISDIICRD